MSAKRKTYSAEFKTKIVLEVLESGGGLLMITPRVFFPFSRDIASKYELLSLPAPEGSMLINFYSSYEHIYN